MGNKTYKRVACPLCGRLVAVNVLQRHVNYWHRESPTAMGGIRPGAGRKVKRLFTRSGAKAILALYYHSIGECSTIADNLQTELKEWLSQHISLVELARAAAHDQEAEL